MRWASSRAGFTLIELLVVILIIGILVAVSAPSFLGQTEKAHDSVAKQYLAVAYREAKASATDREGQFVTSGFDASALAGAIQASEPSLQVSAGACPAATTGDPRHVVVDSAQTSGQDLVLCNDPNHTVWFLTVTAGGAPSYHSQVVALGVQAPVARGAEQPAISGTAEVGQVLTATSGGWNNSPTSYSYRWRHSSDQSSWVDASGAGATSASYTVAASDVGDYLEVVVTASNAAGQATASSADVGPVPAQEHTLTVSNGGHGTISSAPAGIDCGSTCAAGFAAASTVTLTASPDAGYYLAGWSGDCAGTTTCALDMSADRSVSATFAAVGAVGSQGPVTSSVGGGLDRHYATKFAVSGGDLPVTKLHALVKGSGHFSLQVYADNAGQPGALLATTLDMFASNASSFIDYSGLVTTPVTLTNGTSYWLAWHDAGGTNSYGLTDTSTHAFYGNFTAHGSAGADDYTDGPANPFPTSGSVTTGTRTFAIWATDDPQPAGPGTIGSQGPMTDFTSGDADRHYASKFTVSGGDLTINALHVRAEGASGHYLTLQVYANPPYIGTAPSALLATTANIQTDDGTQYKEYSASVTPITLKNGFSYWLAWHSSGGVNFSVTDYTSAALYGNYTTPGQPGADDFADGPADPFPTSGSIVSGNRTFTIWATGS